MNRGIGIVKTKYGLMQGVEKDGITVFRGVPYAAAPVGNLRWRAPEKPEAWDGIRMCDTFSAVAPQLHGQLPDKTLDAAVQNEDCLYLNIWTPAQTPDARLPVFFWIHGGAFLGGIGADWTFHGDHMATHDVIVVTINYRLGVLGYFAHPELSAENPNGVSGNYGLLDQIAALRWVKENIAAFGGDPNRVTIAGQSAGGMSVCSLLTTPLSAGLISGAIIESGGPAQGRGATLAKSEKIGEQFMEKAGCSSIEELRKVDAQELIRVPMERGKWLPFQPNVDGYVLPMTPYEAFVSGHIAKVPVIFGSNTEEGFFFRVQGSYEEKIAAIKEQMGDDFDAFSALYPLDEAHLDRSVLEAGRDDGFANLRRVAQAMEENHPAPVYHYFFGQPLVKIDGTYIGANHSSELYYVFDNLHCIGKYLAEEYEPKLDHNAYELAHTLCTYWTEFVKKGDPNHPGLPYWPAYDRENDLHLNIKAGGFVEAGKPHDPERIEFHDQFAKK